MKISALLLVGLAAVGCGGGGGASSSKDAPGNGSGSGSGSGGRDAGPIDSPPVANADDAVPNGTTFTGSGPVVPSKTGNTLVIWVVSSGSPDYAYKYGMGTSAGATQTSSFTTPLPAATLNADSFGVGQVWLVKDTFTLADGKVTDEAALNAATLGYSAEYAFIYRVDGTPLVSWLGAFPVGLSCGKCVHSSGGGFDTFTPVACDQMQIEADIPTAQSKSCNWT